MAGIFTPSASDSGDVILIKVNSLGNVVWSKRYGGPREERDFSVKQTSDGGYTIIKTDSNGNLQ